MKNNLALLLFFFIFRTVSQAQAPQGIPYQAVARNSSGSLIATTAISVRFTIRDSIATGAIKYREIHSVTTSEQGMFSLTVGQGTVVSGTFAGINWGTLAKFIQVEMDPAGGSSYIELCTQQMMSVPYAMYAERSGNDVTHYVGEVWGGGVVYHVYRGTDGLEHGLILATTDQSTGTEWSNITSTHIGSSAQSRWNGLANSNAIVSQEGHTNSAAKLCLDLVSGGYDDWYLPSRQELDMLSVTVSIVNRSLNSISGATELNRDYWYWSSSESNVTYADSSIAEPAHVLGFWEGTSYNIIPRNSLCYVRSVRAF